VRVAQRRVLDVSGDESRHSPAWGTLRLDLQPQFRGASGARWSHASDEPAHGGGRRGGGPARRRARMGVGEGGGAGAGRVVIEPFVRHTGAVAALPRADVDTDQIIPKPFLKRVERTGQAAGGGGGGGVYRLSIDLAEQRVEDGAGFAARFAIEAYRREMLLHGLDEIGRTLLVESEIAAFECGMRNAECGIDERPS